MKRFSVISLIFSLLFILSCEDKIDTTPPNISFISPTNGSHIEIGYRNWETAVSETELNIQVDIKDNEQVLKAECFIDNISYGVKSGSTFNWKIDAYPTLRQGNHIIKIIAEDINNNKSESSINFILDVYHIIRIESFILETNDDYTWTFTNSAEDGNNSFTYEVLTLTAIAYESIVLKDGIYKLVIRDESWRLAISSKIDFAKSMDLRLSISGNSYVLEIKERDN